MDVRPAKLQNECGVAAIRGVRPAKLQNVEGSGVRGVRPAKLQNPGCQIRGPGCQACKTDGRWVSGLQNCKTRMGVAIGIRGVRPAIRGVRTCKTAGRWVSGLQNCKTRMWHAVWAKYLLAQIDRTSSIHHWSIQELEASLATYSKLISPQINFNASLMIAIYWTTLGLNKSYATKWLEHCKAIITNETYFKRNLFDRQLAESRLARYQAVHFKDFMFKSYETGALLK